MSLDSTLVSGSNYSFTIFIRETFWQMYIYLNIFYQLGLWTSLR